MRKRKTGVGVAIKDPFILGRDWGVSSSQPPNRIRGSITQGNTQISSRSIDRFD